MALTSDPACDEGTMNLQHARTDLLEFPLETQAKLKKQVKIGVRRHSIYSLANHRRHCVLKPPLIHCQPAVTVSACLPCLTALSILL